MQYILNAVMIQNNKELNQLCVLIYTLTHRSSVKWNKNLNVRRHNCNIPVNWEYNSIPYLQHQRLLSLDDFSSATAIAIIASMNFEVYFSFKYITASSIENGLWFLICSEKKQLVTKSPNNHQYKDVRKVDGKFKWKTDWSMISCLLCILEASFYFDCVDSFKNKP